MAVWERIEGRITIMAGLHVHCMTFYEAKTLQCGSWEMMSLRGVEKYETRGTNLRLVPRDTLTGSFRILSVIS